jgi:CRISPR-associated protein Cmr1
METLECTVRFTTPAFLGGADQGAQWRTPPFKALLRQWWRVAECGGKKPDLANLRQREGELFGRAADQGTTASRVRLRLGDWQGGGVPAGAWKATTGKVKHPEAERANYQVDAALYLGYGPLDAHKEKGHVLKRPSALANGQPRSWKIGVPDAEAARFREVLRLCHAFGALGSRCRNGWGSLHFERGGLGQAELAALFDPARPAGRDWLRLYARNWKDALDADWCHSLGKDQKGLLVWRAGEVEQRWEDVLKALAQVKIAFRTQFHFQGGGPHAALCHRQVLAYPITNHALGVWGKDARNANQVVFKVLPVNGGYAGLVAHLPHGLPRPLLERLPGANPNEVREIEQAVWPKVHKMLDQHLTRLP